MTTVTPSARRLTSIRQRLRGPAADNAAATAPGVMPVARAAAAAGFKVNVIGVGASGVVPSRAGDLTEGPAWWAAREAVETVHALQERTIPGARTWIVAAEGEDEASLRLSNAYLLARDQLVSAMSERTRRLAYGRLLGQTQKELARAEGITQSAVSQALAAAGVGALVEGARQLQEAL